MRTIVYDAIEDDFDVAYLNPESPQGMRLSEMTIKQIEDNKY